MGARQGGERAKNGARSPIPGTATADDEKRGGRDFRTGNTIDIHAYFDDAIDVQHIFPQRWCATNGIADGIANCVVNKAAIDAHTTRRMGRNAPSSYLARLENDEGIEPADLDAILRSHDIDSVALRQYDFPAFFNNRFEQPSPAS